MAGLALAACVPKLPPGPAPTAPGEPPAAGGAGSLLPLVRQRVLEAHVLAARGELSRAHLQLARAEALWPAGAPLLAAESTGWVPPPEEQDGRAAVLQEARLRPIRETALYEDDPDLLGHLTGGLHTPEGFARAPELVLLAELRLAVRRPTPEQLRRLRHAAAELGDAPRLERLPSPALPAGPGLHCQGEEGLARGEAEGAGGYPVGNSAGVSRVGVPAAVAPAWAAYRAGRPREARLLVERAYRESGGDEGVLVWLRLIQGVPGEASLGGVP